ncbi:MAG TPA: DUF3617 family protein [Thermoanaerobaculia bacterium]|nr:DUF3617 family protein [Thermoanaerobaculia bacterium]
MKVRVLVVCLALIAPAVMADPSPVKAGKWQLSMQMDMPGMPFKMPAVKFTHCITEEDVKSAIPQDQKNKDCKLGEHEVDGNTIRWTVDCPKQKMTGKGEITYDGDSMDGSMVMNSDGQEITTKYTGKRLGDCDKK